MSEQDDVLRDLDAGQVMAGLRWAAASSASRTIEDFDGDTGHDQGWLGYTLHKLLKDRLDRVFSCGRFAVGPEDDDAVGLDILGAGLTQEELRTMPKIAPGVVVRNDLNGSPGWSTRRWRWLLASFPFGEADRIAWAQKSPTKQRVASSSSPDQLAFDDAAMGIATVAHLLTEMQQHPQQVATTLVLGHSLDADTGRAEMPLGRPRFNFGGGDAWYWRTDILASGGPEGSRGGVFGTPTAAEPGPRVPDAPVRLRRVDERAGEAGNS